jgi:transcription elongation factor Elf1
VDIPLPGDTVKAKPKMMRTGHCGRCGKNRYAGSEYYVFDRAYNRKLYVCQRCGRKMGAMSGYEAEQTIYMEGGA